MGRTAVLAMVLCLAVLTPLSTAQLDVFSSPRRELVEVDLSHFFNYCWRKTTVRVTNDCNTTVTSEDGNSTTPKVCYTQCPDGTLARGPICIQDCSLLNDTTTMCGAACTVDSSTCIDVTKTQITSAVKWIKNTVVPLSGAMGKLAKALLLGLGFTMAAPVNTNLQLSGPAVTADTSFIALKTLEKRTLMAALLATHGVRKGPVAPALVDTGGRDPRVVLQQWLANYYVPIEAPMRFAAEMMFNFSALGITINIEDIAKLDPSGTLGMLVAFGHPMCTRSSCPRCNVTANPCIASVGCNNGRCTAPTFEPDGTPCVTTDIDVHTVSGFCSSGTCQTATQTAYINSMQHRHIWFPARADAAAARKIVLPRVADGVAKGSKQGYVVTALAYWQQTAKQSKSCSFNNGGCGVKLCAVKFKRPRKTYCIDSKALGFVAAPFATAFPGGITIAHMRHTEPLDCLKACSKRLACKLAVTTRGRECWLKATIPKPKHNQDFFQAYKLVHRRFVGRK